MGEVDKCLLFGYGLTMFGNYGLMVAVAVRSTFPSMLFTVCTVIHLHLLSTEHDLHRVYFVCTHC